MCFVKICLKGDVIAIFSGGKLIEDISSFILSYYELKLHFLSLRIDFLKSKMTPKNDQFLVIFKVKIGRFWGSFWTSKSQFSVIKIAILAHNSLKWCRRCPLSIPTRKHGEKIAFHAIFCQNHKIHPNVRFTGGFWLERKLGIVPYQ